MPSMIEPIGQKLTDKSLLCSSAYIAGEWRTHASDNKTFDVINPSTHRIIATLPDMGQEETKEAIGAAYNAQKDWAKKQVKNVLPYFVNGTI